MTSHSELQGARKYIDAVRDRLDLIASDQQEAIGRAATAVVEAIEAGGLVFLFGTGHSHMLAEEGHYRAGGFAAVCPVLCSSLMLHEGAVSSSRMERTSGLGPAVLARYRPTARDVLFVFSNSGVNPLPVEMALAGHARGLYVVGVSSHAYARVAPLSPIGRRLDEVVDAAIDNGCAPGDAQLPLRDGWAVAAASTVVCATIWNGLVAEAANRLQEAGVQPPVFASLNMDGAAAHNERLLAKWRPRNPHL